MNRVIFFIFFFIPYFLSSQNNKSEYLEKHHQIINDSVKLKYSFKSKIIFAGEEHNKKGKYELNHFFYLNILKNTTAKCVFVFELPLNRQKYINDYLLNGEEKILEIITGDGYHILRNEKTTFFRTLREIWLQQPDSIKFQIKCIDIPNTQYNVFSNLSMLMKNEDYPQLESFEKLVRVGNKKKYSRKTAIKILQLLEKESQIYSNIFHEYLGNDYNEFINQIKGGLILLTSFNTNTSEGMEAREQYIYENFKQIINENPNSVFFAQFGQAHVSLSYQKNWIHLKNWNSLAARLNTNIDSPVKNSVISIIYCSSSNIEKEATYFIEPIIKKEDISLFLKYSTTPLTLFKLDGEDTPFKEMAEKFQYIIINKY